MAPPLERSRQSRWAVHRRRFDPTRTVDTRSAPSCRLCLAIPLALVEPEVTDRVTDRVTDSQQVSSGVESGPSERAHPPKMDSSAPTTTTTTTTTTTIAGHVPHETGWRVGRGPIATPAEAIQSDPATFKPNEEVFWKALNRVSISVSSSRGYDDGATTATTAATGEGGDDTLIKESLRAHLSREKRLFDILCFKQGSMPLFEFNSPRARKKPPLAANGGLHHHQANGSGKLDSLSGALDSLLSGGEASRVLARISDRQGPCIVSLKPSLLYPRETEDAFVEASLAEDCHRNCCNQNRNRKTLGNYKNTGFCQYHVHGNETGSEEHWRANQCKTVRGFNLQRNAGESKLRHMLCLDTENGKVFLKWCTQCHLWKNFSEFCQSVDNPAVTSPTIDTFCGNCHRRQVASREKQLLKRRNERNIKQLAASDNKAQEPALDSANANANAMVVAQAMSLVHNGGNGANTLLGDAPGGGPLAQENLSAPIDALRTPEIQEMQKENSHPNGLANGHHDRDAGNAAAAATATLSSFDSAGPPLQHLKTALSAVNGSGKKRSKRKVVELNPEEAKRLKEIQLELLNQYTLTDFPFWYQNEREFLEALDTVKVGKVTLREYYSSPDRLGDILYFSRGNLPHFSEENNPIPKRGNLSEIMERDRSKGIVYYPSLRVSDAQKVCINSLRPALIFPDQDNTWRCVETNTSMVCQEIRNTSEAKKKLENYKFTGFCNDCVRGEGQASQEAWVQAGGSSIRGFNLGRKKVDHRPRHLLCLEREEGKKVFVKWCTQCHTWKNLASYFIREGEEGGNKLNTFCAICHRRQQVSRKMQSQTRKIYASIATKGTQFASSA